MMHPELEAKLRVLRAGLSGRQVVIAFSGGLDSRFLAHTAKGAGADIQLVHIAGPHVPPGETEAAQAWAKARALPLTVLELDVLADEQVAANSRERCYHCKRLLFSAMLGQVSGAAGQELCDGTNASDMETYRPGLRAIRELGVRSPLAEANLSKVEIRLAAEQTGLDNPGQPSGACLLTRFAYGFAPDRAMLERLGRAEAAVRSLLAREGALCEFRLRLTAPDALPELHLAGALASDMCEAVARAVEEQGLPRPTMRFLEGGISGYYDRKA